jgi:hypothetical protein
MRRRTFTIVVAVLTIGLAGGGCGGEATVDDTVATTVDDPAESTVPESTTTVAPPAAATESTTAAPEKDPVFDFPTSDDVNEWSVVNDTVMGGVSSGQLAWEDEALVFTGDLSLDNNGGFASVRSPLVDPTAVAEWATSDGMRVELGGDGRTWTVEVRMDFADGGWTSTVTTSADEITTVDLPWSSFEPVTRFLDPREANEPLDPARIVSVAFYLVDGIEAPFRLELHSIS